MEKRIPYSLYKTGYHQFPASDYDPKTKTILVDMPTAKRRVWPKGWKRDGNHYTTPGGCTVYFWNTGIAQNYLVERFFTAYYSKTRQFRPGLIRSTVFWRPWQSSRGVCEKRGDTKMIQVKVIFQSGNTLIDSLNTKEEADEFFGKYYPDGKASYEIVNQPT